MNLRKDLLVKEFKRPVNQSRILTKENYQFFALFILSVFFVYYTSPVISRIFFLIILIQYLRSKQNYFWIAFAFVLLNCPGGFFIGSLSSDTQRLPLYSFGAGFSFSFFDLFFILSVIKVITGRKRSSGYYFKDSLFPLVFYGIFLLIGSLILGMSLYGTIQFGRSALFPILFFLITPFLISDYGSFIKLVKLILPFIVLSAIGQIYEISYGHYLISIIKSGDSTIASTGAALAEGSEEVARIFDAEFLNTLSIIICSFLLIRGDKNFKPLYLMVLIFLNFIVCFTSATRGPFMTFTVILIIGILLFFLSARKNSGSLKYILFLSIVIISGTLLIQLSPVLSTQVERASERFGTLGILFGGDVSIGNENDRTAYRIPRLMRKFHESPVIGWGFSDEGMEYQDGHVGFHNMLREGGILELVVFTIFFLQVAGKLWILSKRHGILPSERNSLLFAAVAFLSLMIEHSSSSQMFGYFIGFTAIQKWFFFSILLGSYNIYYKQTEQNIINRLKKIKI